MKIKYLLITAVLATVILCSAGAVQAQGVTVQDLMNQIAQLTAQLQALQAQQNQTPAWCFDFTRNLGFAQSGSADVGALHHILDAQGFSYSPDTGNIYDEGTAHAVIQFQTKYGFSQSGYVGPITRAQLNSLYPCAQTTVLPKPITPPVPPIPGQSSITVTSPNGGENWTFGNTYNISWKSNGVDRVNIELEKWGGNAGGPFTQIIDENISASLVTYSWPLGQIKGGSVASTGNSYKIRIVKTGDNSSYSQQIADGSDNYFAITAPTTQPSITVTSPNGGETFFPGQQVTIKYTANNFPRAINVQIQLNKGADYSGNGGYNPVGNNATNYIPNTGSYTFTIPASAVSGNNYSFMINSDYPGTETSAIFHSNNFSVVTVPVTPPVPVIPQTCAPNWVCGAWTTCSSSKQTRTCSDTNNCGTALPSTYATTQTCVLKPIIKPPVPVIPKSTSMLPEQSLSSISDALKIIQQEIQLLAGN